ncbi:MAG: hypothetical protein KC478_11870 [Bacteriovoracaceae bacterium]|nr:hypothetical protein [Bacteriovoracaceae bacterium]
MKKILLFSFLILSGCSFKSLVLPNLSFIIADRIDSTLHLYNEQEYEVRDAFKKLLTEEKDRFKKIQTYFNAINIQEVDEKKGYQFFADNYLAIALKVNRILAKQMARLDKNQIEKYRKTLLEDNEDVLKRANEKKPKDFYKRYSYFFGDLTEDQKALIKKNMSLFRELAKRRMDERLRTQKELDKVLVLEDVNQKEKLIIRLFDQNADRSKLTSERKKSMIQFKTFVKTLTPKQVKYFQKKRKDIDKWFEAYFKYY